MTLEHKLINELVALGLSTTTQARVVGVSVNVIKNHQQGRPAKALTLEQLETLEKLGELLR